MISIGTKAPAFKATVYNNGNKESLSSEDLAGSWYVLYWWPFDFTGVCNSEIIGFQELEKEFADLDVKLVGASCDSFFSHKAWFSDTDSFPNGAPSHPIVADTTHKLTKDFGFYFEATGSPVRGTVLVDPEGIVRSFGANFLNVARDPQDILTTARGFIAGGCSLPARKAL